MAGIEDLYPEFQEFARRSARNLGIGAQTLYDNARANNSAIRAGADATRKLMAGGDMADLDAVHNSPIAGFGTDAGGPAPGGAFLGTFVGRNAAQVPQRFREFAGKAAQRGMDNEAIRQKYGWFQDKAGDWKFEISDHRAELRVDPKDPNKVILYHPELRRQYPDLVDTLKIGDLPNTDMFGRPNPTVAEYRRTTNTANINWSAANTPQEALKALLHELQHGVQFKEGHSPGTAQNSDEIGHLVNTEYWPRYDRIENDIAAGRRFRENWLNTNPGATIEDFDKANPDWWSQYAANLSERNNFPGINDWTFDKYWNALGEVEARSTMNRMDLTPLERRNLPPDMLTSVNRDKFWDVRDVTKDMQPRKAAEEPPTLRQIITRHLGLSPE